MRLFKRNAQSGESSRPETPDPPPAASAADAPTRDSAEAQPMPLLREMDNRARRIRRLALAQAYWRELEALDAPVPYLRVLFVSEREGMEALESLPFITTAEDTGNIVCTEPLTLVYCRTGSGFEVAFGGESLLHDRWHQVRRHLLSRGGSVKNECRPASRAGEDPHGPKVRFLREYVQVGLRASRRVRVYRAESAAAARIFLRERGRFDVQGGEDILVETPEGVLGPDAGTVPHRSLQEPEDA